HLVCWGAANYAAGEANNRGCKIGSGLPTVITSSSNRRATSRTCDDYFLSDIGGAVFSAGAGGRAGLAPSCCACASGRAGSGAGVVGRSPPGFDSAGALPSVVDGVPCNGCVA